MSDAARRPGSDPILDAIADQVAESTALRCENCGEGMPESSKICTRCGTNMATGKSIKTQVLKAKKEKGAKSKSGSGETFVISPAAVGVTLGLILLGLLILGLAMPETMPLYLIVLAIIGLVTWIYGVYSAFKDQQIFAAICGLTGCLVVTQIYFTIYCMFITHRDMLKVLAFVSVGGSIMNIVLLIGTGTNVETYMFDMQEQDEAYTDDFFIED